jgi:hypothetical protein
MLEIAVGTGVVTRHLASVLPANVSIVATDLNQPMPDLPSVIGAKRLVAWRQADGMQLPFPKGTFDADWRIDVSIRGIVFLATKPSPCVSISQQESCHTALVYDRLSILDGNFMALH